MEHRFNMSVQGQELNKAINAINIWPWTVMKNISKFENL